MNAPWSPTRPAVGTFVKLPAPEVVEVLAAAGLDFVIIDNEHASTGPQTVSTMIAIARGCGIAPFVRVPGHDPRDVQAPLDAGAAGLLLPHVDDAAQARSVVSACRFPPLGTRGVSNSGRAGGWGRSGLPAYLRAGNEQIVLVAQLESPTAMTNAGAIASTEGIDAVMIGPGDLAVTAGYGPADPRLHAMITATEHACAQAGHTLGITAPDGAGAAERFTRGYRFVVVATDTALLARAVGQTLTAVSGTNGRLRGRSGPPSPHRPAEHVGEHQ